MEIKTLKIGENIYEKLDESVENEEIKDILSNIDKLKAIAIDTVMWQVGQKVKESVKNDVNLSASNAKGIVLLAKILSELQPSATHLSKLEAQSWQKMLSLAKTGYADSNLLVNALSSVEREIGSGASKVERIMRARKRETIIKILNEE